MNKELIKLPEKRTSKVRDRMIVLGAQRMHDERKQRKAAEKEDV